MNNQCEVLSKRQTLSQANEKHQMESLIPSDISIGFHDVFDY